GANLDNVAFDTVWRGKDLQGSPTEEVLNCWIVSTLLLSHDVLTPQVKGSRAEPWRLQSYHRIQRWQLPTGYDGTPYWHRQFKITGNIDENPELLTSDTEQEPSISTSRNAGASRRFRPR